jgi:hypothetical protein
MDAKEPDATRQADASTSAATGMRIYSAILGHVPEVDPTAPDPFVPQPTDRLRQIADLLHLAPDAQGKRHIPTWRQLLEGAAAATESAGKRLDEARQRMRDRAA